MAKEQPVIKITPSLTDKIIEAVIVLEVIVFWVYTITHYNALPEVIPTHFAGEGKPDGYGLKWTILTLPIIATLFYIGLSILGRYPHKFNYPGTITEKNAATQYRIGSEMLRGMKGSVITVFLVMNYQTVQTAMGLTDGMGHYGMLLDFAIIFVPLFYFLIKMSKNA